MPAPFDVETLGNGASLATVDAKGNLTIAGSANIGGALALLKQAAAPVQVPGELQLYTLDGQSLSMVAPSGAITPVSFGPQYAAATLGAPVTVTGVTAKTQLLAGPTVPAGALTAGQVYRVTAWGALTTTASTQTVQFEVDYGATDVFTWGAQQPNSGGTVTGAAWMLDITLLAQSATSMTGCGLDSLNFFPSSENQQAPAAVSATVANTFSLQLTPSAAAVSVTCNGAVIRRVN
jgi:hypothetical protein